MARPGRLPAALIQRAREHLVRLAPDRRGTPFRLRQLDGPPGAPRFAVTATHCPENCTCANPTSCPQRRTIRLLLSREGDLIRSSDSSQCQSR